MPGTTKPTPTPGYNRRLAIWFGHDKHGRKIAYYWGAPHSMRSFRMPLDEAELAIATDTADLLDGNPLPRPKGTR